RGLNPSEAAQFVAHLRSEVLVIGVLASDESRETGIEASCPSAARRRPDVVLADRHHDEYRNRPEGIVGGFKAGPELRPAAAEQRAEGEIGQPEDDWPEPKTETGAGGDEQCFTRREPGSCERH